MKRIIVALSTCFFLLTACDIFNSQSINSNIVGTWSYSQNATYVFEFEANSVFNEYVYSYGIKKVINGTWSATEKIISLKCSGKNTEISYYYTLNGNNELASVTPQWGGASVSLVKGKISIPATDISIESGYRTLTVNGSNTSLGIEAYPSTTTDEISVVSRNNDIVTVSSEGVVTDGYAGADWTITPGNQGTTIIDVACGSIKKEVSFNVAIMSCSISSVIITQSGGGSYQVKNDGEINTDAKISFEIEFTDGSSTVYTETVYDLVPGEVKTRTFSYGRIISKISLKSIDVFDSYLN